MTSCGKILGIVLIIALTTSVFFVFGVHELKNHFCPINAATGICGFLGGLVNVIDHIFSMNLFLVIILPALVSFIALLAYSLLLPVFVQEPLSFRVSPSQPKVKVKESRWARFHINSPTL